MNTVSRFIILHFFYIAISFIAFSNFQEASAIDLGSERFRLSGFGTIGITHAGKNQFGYRNELAQNGQFGNVSAIPGSVLGFQLDADLLSNLSATIQAVGKERTKYNFDNIVDWAYLRYQITPNAVARAGRMGVDLFMLSEYRNVGFAYLWAQPIVEFYTPFAFSHFDGFDFKYTYPISAGYLEFKFFGGRSGADFTTEAGDVNVRLGNLIGGNASLETDYWKVRLGFANAKFDTIRSPVDPLLDNLNQIPLFLWPQKAELLDTLDGREQSVTYYSAGVAYDNNIWLMQSEVSLVSSNWTNASMINGYVSVGRRIGAFTLYSVAAKVKSRDKITRVTSPLLPPSDAINALVSNTQNAMNSPRLDQNTISLGVRWDLYPKMALKAQWDHTWVKKNGNGLLIRKGPLDKNITLNTFTLNLSYVF